MQQFNIRQNSTLPYLEMELINDGRNNFNKAYMALQSASATFNMVDEANNVKKIVNAKTYIVPIEDKGCIEKVKIQYRWNKRDTDTAGIYKGQFRIKFDGSAKVQEFNFPTGEMFVPIAEELIISISDNFN